MLRARIIPCLLLKNGSLVKTTRFEAPKYVGDPLNTVRIFNEKEVDELIVADIDATVNETPPDFDLIEKLAVECRMPLCYSGGVTTVQQVERIIGLGVEKVAMGCAAMLNPKLINQAATRVGSQSIVVVMDVKKDHVSKKYEVFTHNGTKPTGIDPLDFALLSASLGAGELLINSIDNDGMLCGYDTEVMLKIRASTKLPVTLLGGASGIDDCSKLIRRFGEIGAAAGSMFVFKGRFKAVLMQYPSREEKNFISRIEK